LRKILKFFFADLDSGSGTRAIREEKIRIRDLGLTFRIRDSDMNNTQLFLFLVERRRFQKREDQKEEPRLSGSLYDALLLLVELEVVHHQVQNNICSVEAPDQIYF
jgi:hypothetical protein